ncbi:LytR family transcriptional regulator, partial [Streptomyces sp. T21Q-yed]|nr:LytR family transcriptional regulator [Streptomyces sp. T21Q-yed]
MNDWPGGWSDDNRGDRYGRGSSRAQPEGARVMRQVRRGPAAPPGQGYGGVPQQPSYVNGQGHGGYGDDPVHDDGYDSGYNTGQVYGGS